MFTSIQEYIDVFPPDVQKILQQIRAAIKKAAPKATEVISYGMPAFKLNEVLVYFAVCKNHIGFYPTAKPIIIFKKELAAYKTSKGAIQFSFNEPLPLRLITQIVKFRIDESLNRVKKNNRRV